MYLKIKAIKQKLHERGYQITPSALSSMDANFDDYLNRLMGVWNGHHKRITPELVNIIKMDKKQ